MIVLGKLLGIYELHAKHEWSWKQMGYLWILFSLSENRYKLGGMLADDSASMVTHGDELQNPHPWDELDLNQ